MSTAVPTFPVDGITDTEHSFQPPPLEVIETPHGVPASRADPGLAKEFKDEIVSKVMTGRKRMYWFANHVILFMVGIIVAIALKSSLYPDLEYKFFLVPFQAWAGLLVMHLYYTMMPILKVPNLNANLRPLSPNPKSRRTRNK